MKYRTTLPKQVQEMLEKHDSTFEQKLKRALYYLLVGLIALTMTLIIVSCSFKSCATYSPSERADGRKVIHHRKKVVANGYSIVRKPGNIH